MTNHAAHSLLAGAVGWPDPTSLVWREVVLPPGEPIDPFALAAAAGRRPGFVLASAGSVVAACGAAAVLVLPEGLAGDDCPGAVRDWLAAVPRAPEQPEGSTPQATTGPVDAIGPSGPVVVGALPFASDAPARLVVPTLCYVRTVEVERVILVEPADAPAATMAGAPGAAGTNADHRHDGPALRRALARMARPSPRPRPPARVVSVDDRSGAGFAHAVGEALDAIARGTVTKVVLARPVVASFDAPLEPEAVLHRLAAHEPTATVFGLLDEDAFVGASPELLVARHGTRVESWPLAGTVALSGEAAGDAAAVRDLTGSAKERDEHGQTVDAIVGALAPLCESTPEVTGPSVARLRTVAHLASRVSGTLRDSEDALTLVRALHPTPAVAGTPTADALALLGSLESAGRGRYAGPVGWMDAEGDGDFVVAIRGASVAGDRATLYAGAGIVAGSDPERELAETGLKLRTALGALGVA